jgi:transposase InsO family protein
MVRSKENVTGGTMPREDAMTIDERRKYLRICQPRYQKASRKERTKLLNEMAQVTGLDRKTLIRLMKGDLKRKRRRKQRGRSYGADVDDVLRVVWDSYGFLCAERLTPNLMEMTQHLAAHGELRVSGETLDKLSTISISTVYRHQKRLTQDVPRLPRKHPKNRNPYTHDVPMKRIAWDEPEPGHFEVDLVHHSGPSTSGDYVHTLQMVDVATGWSECVALLGRSYVAMEHAFRIALARLPFPIVEIHSDNGIEFFNNHLSRFWGEIAHIPQLSRSRPYHKNDNRFVEQKNHSLVRTLLGKERLDSVTQVLALNQLYDKLWLYYNFFQPVMRLQEKIYTSDEGEPSRVKRRFDKARPPFDRLCAAGVLTPQRQRELETLRAETNPRRLRMEIDQLADHLFTLDGATPGITEDVFETLVTVPSSQRRDNIPVTLSFDRTTSPR